jgi:hypothetical protein
MGGYPFGMNRFLTPVQQVPVVSWFWIPVRFGNNDSTVIPLEGI